MKILIVGDVVKLTIGNSLYALPPENKRDHLRELIENERSSAIINAVFEHEDSFSCTKHFFAHVTLLDGVCVSGFVWCSFFDQYEEV